MSSNPRKNTLIICLSTESINADIWTNKQHLMTRLSKIPGYDVIYVDQGMSTRELKKAIKQLDWSYFLKPVWNYNDHLRCISFYILPLIKGGFIKRLSWKILYLFLNIWVKFEEYEHVIVWVYQPQSWYLVEKINWDKRKYSILYDCVDDFKSQPFYNMNIKRRQELVQIEKNLVESADVVTTTSMQLFEDKKKLNNSTYYVHNVGDFDHFKKPEISLPKAFSFLSTLNQKKVVYAGVVDDYKIDLELIDKVTDDEKFYFIFLGPIRVQEMKDLFQKIKSKNNVYFHGYLGYNELPAVLHSCDIIWLPYQKNEHTQYVFPLKLFEAFATGKQVVAKNLESYRKFNKYMQIFENEANALKELSREFDSKASEKRKSVAKENSWDSRLVKILKIINDESNING